MENNLSNKTGRPTIHALTLNTLTIPRIHK